MAVDLIVTYKAEVDDLTNKLKVVVDRLDAMEKESKQAAKGLDETTKAADKLDKELSTTGKSTKTATDNIKNFSKTAKTELNGLSSSVKSFGAGIAASLGVAFSVDAIIQFGKASVNAFLEAEENANKLKFAVTQIAGESEVAFQRLIDQSEELQKISIFSDDSIQQAQTALATFGLASSEIEQLIPKILDFASATKKEVPEAASIFIRALEGQTRGLVEAGIKFKDTGTILGNYNELLQSTTKFTGATEEATRTLTGQMKSLDNQADELQESLGSRFAASLTELRFATFKLFETIIKGFDTVEQKRAEASKNQRALLQDAIEANIAGDAALNNLTVEEEAQRRFIETGQKILDIKKQLKADPLLFPKLSDELDELTQTAGILKDIITLEKQRKATEGDALTVEFIRLQTTKDLNKLLLENSKLSGAAAKDNVTLINAELEARKKANEEAKKANEKLQQERLAGEQKAWEEFKAQLLKEQDELLGVINRTQDKIKEEAALLEFKVKITAQVEGEDAALIQARDALFKIFQDESIQADVTSNTVEEANAKKQKAYEEYITNLTKLVGDFAMFEVKTTEETAKTQAQIWLEKNQEQVNLTVQLMNELTTLYNTFANQRINDAQKTADAEIQGIDRALQANDEALKNRRISEREAANEEIRLEQERVKAEAEADKKIRAIKRQQAIINKAAAIAQIAIDTARNAINQPGPLGALVPYWIALGAAQAAIVAAQPIPYKKGSKKTKEGLARVGEEGEEIVWMPGNSKVLPAKQTKTYGAALDAMFDNRFDKWVIDNYAPRLVQQQKVHKENEVKSFSKNLADSLTVNVASPNLKNRDKVALTNVEELAEAIVRSSYISPYRR